MERLLAFSARIYQLQRILQNQGVAGLLRFLSQYLIAKTIGTISYQEWMSRHVLTRQDIQDTHYKISQWQYHPRFSIIMPVYNVEARWLEKAIASVRNQIYPNWELCIADDASSQSHIRPLLNHYSQLDARIKVVFRSINGHISAASNSALELATGDYVALLDHDDELAIDALFENAKLINNHPEADFIYSDEDKINSRGRRFDPFFKPDWSPDYFHACMYTCHLGVYRTKLLREVGGFRSEYDGAQDYDLVLRVVEKTKNIYHISRVLYHWRTIESSVASGEQAKPWAYTAASKALEAMLERSPYPGYVETGLRLGFFRVRRRILNHPLISIVIPSAGKTINTPTGSLCLVSNCVQSIQKLSTYRNFEIVIVDGYDIPEQILTTLSAPNLQLDRCNKPFNFSQRINQGVERAKGKFIVLLNDDCAVITPDWLESMLELAQQEEMGAVGAKLFFPNSRLQHVGVTVINGNPVHPFYGCRGNHLGYFCSNVVNRNYFAVTGACLMIRHELLQKLGGLDEDFSLNYNDVDLCLKAFNAGYRNVYTPYAQLVHYESATRTNVVLEAEWRRLNEKWNNIIARDPYYNSNFSSAPNFRLPVK